jgi:hypothetical protein
MRWCSWLRNCATSRKVTGSTPDGVTGIFHWHNPSSCTMALGLAQSLTEMRTMNNSLGGKGGWCVGLTTFICRMSWNLGPSNSWKPIGLSRPVMGLLYLYLYVGTPNTYSFKHTRCIIPVYCTTVRNQSTAHNSTTNYTYPVPSTEDSITLRSCI